MNQPNLFEVIIIGGSYAGLSAAMALGRSRRNVVILDSANPCNKQSPHSHNFLTHDGDKPCDITAVAKEQVMQYPTITFVHTKAVATQKNDGVFEIQADNGQIYHAKKILFASGLTDVLPDIPGFAECWGVSILHCPYCHGYEFSGRATGILNNGMPAFEMAKMLGQWTDDLTIFTNGKAVFSKEEYAFFKLRSVNIVEDEIKQISNRDGQMTQIVFKDGKTYPLEVLYAHPHTRQQCDFAVKFGCAINDHGCLDTDTFQRTNITGIYAAGDCTSVGRAVSVAVAAGSVAGMFINKELVEESYQETIREES